MEIIKEGKIKAYWIGECRSCKSIARAEQNEFKNAIEAGDYRSDFENFVWENCPVCGRGPYGGMLFHEEHTKSAKRVMEQIHKK